MFMSVDQQIELFTGCVFDLRRRKVILPNGSRVSRAQFDVAFGGMTFALDRNNEFTTRSAWRAFIYNDGFRPPLAPWFDD